jgi:hypothetical protein
MEIPLNLLQFKKKDFMIRCFLLVVLLNTIFVVNSLAAELTTDLQQKANVLLCGVDDMIMRINSGVCRIIGKTERPGGRVVNDDILIAFDYYKHFYRFDNGTLIKTLLTPDFYYELWNPGEQTASVKRSPATDMKVSNVFCDIVDVRYLFFFVPVGHRKPFEYQNSAFHKQIEKLKILNYEDMTNDLASVTIEYFNPYNYETPLIGKFVVNKTNGYTVQHIEYNNGVTVHGFFKKTNFIATQTL